MKNTLSQIIFLACIVTSCSALSSCFKDQWSGFFYPNENNLLIDENLGTFSSLEECRQAAEDKIDATENKNADYECGLNCDISKGKPYVCEKTER